MFQRTICGELHSETAALKHRLVLPSTKDEWAAADKFFAEHVVPAVLGVQCPDEKNSILVESVYHYFEQRFGTQTVKPPKHHRRRVKHDRALSTVNRLKKEARRELTIYTRD